MITASSFSKNSNPISVQGGAELGEDAPTILAALKLNSEHRMLMKYKYGGDTMKTKTLLWACAAVLFSAMVAGCVSTNEHSGGMTSRQARKVMAAINYDSESGGNLVISNYSGEDLVFFAGKITRNNILGGVKAGGQNRAFDIKKSLQGLINGKGVFMVYGVRASTYRNSLESGEAVTKDDIVFSHTVCFDFSDREFKQYINVDSISGKGGAKEFIKLENHTPYPVELRLNGPDAEKILTLYPYETGRRFYLAPDPDNEGYQIWPTYLIYNAKTGEMSSVQGKPNDTRTVLPTIDGQTVDPFVAPKENLFSSSIAYLRITNAYRDGITLKHGVNTKKSQLQNGLINSGRTETYEFAATEEGKLTPGLSIRLGRMGETLQFGDNLVLKAGYTYDADVYDDNGVARLKLSAPVKRDISATGSVQLLLE